MLIKSCEIDKYSNYSFKNAQELKDHYERVRKRLFKPEQEIKNIVENKSVLRDREKYKKRIRIATIVAIVSYFYKTTDRDVLVGKTTQSVRYRYITMYLAYHVGGWSIADISNSMNYKQTTVYHGVLKIRDHRKVDVMLDSDLKAISLRVEKLRGV